MVVRSIEEELATLRELYSRSDGPRAVLEYVTQQALEAEVSEHLNAGRHERTAERSGYRNGYKPRTLGTRVGKLELEVPQVRDCQPYQPSLWQKWQRHERALLVACAEMYFQGVSTRKVQEVLEAMCAGEISAMTVSRVAAELDEKLKAFRKRSLKLLAYPYLQIDARYEHVRIGDQVVSQAVLVVFGYNSLGCRELLDWRVADSESEASWGELFRDLKARGLHGVRLVTSDAHSGIRSALSRHFQGVCWQRCQVHYKREISKKVGSRKYREIQADVKTMLGAGDKAACLRCRDELVEKWGKKYPEVARMLEGVEDCLSVLAFPAEHRSRLASTNHAENLMLQLRRRTAVVNVFPNVASLDRLVGALLLEEHESWVTRKKPVFNMADLWPLEQEVAMV